MATTSFVRRPAFVLLATVVLSAAFTVPLLCRGQSNEKGKEEDTSMLAGKAAPNFSLDTIDGKKVKLSELKGNVVVLDFWATWCPPCRASLPHVQHVSEDKNLAAKGLKVFAVNSQEEKDTVQGFLDKNHYSFAVPMDKEGTAGKSYLITGIPTTVLVGRDGIIKKVWIGYDADSTAKEIDDAVKDALKAESPAS